MIFCWPHVGFVILCLHSLGSRASPGVPELTLSINIRLLRLRTRYHRLTGLNNRNLFLHRSEGWKVQGVSDIIDYL